MEIYVAAVELFLAYRRTESEVSKHSSGAPKIGYGEWWAERGFEL
jgi:hypothetical protein